MIEKPITHPPIVRETLKSLLDASQGEGEIFELLALSNGVITPEIEEKLERVAVAIPAKVDSYRNFQALLSARLDFITNKIAELTRIKKSLGALSERADEYVFTQMKTHGLRELEGNESKFKIVSCAKRTVITDEKLIPHQFKTIVTTETIDKLKLKSAIEDGEIIPGAELQGGETLRCYPKLK